jgi:hypothetical protein
MDTNLIVSVKDISFFSSLGTVFDLAKWKKEQHLQEEDKMHILSAHISQKNLVLFGEPKLECGLGAVVFSIRLYSRSNFCCVAASKRLGAHVATQRSKVSISGDWVVLFQSFLHDKTGQDTVHLFSWTEGSKELVHRASYVLNLPPRKFLVTISCDQLFLAGIRKPGTLVEVWQLPQPPSSGLCSQEVAVVWSRDVGNRNTVTCTSLHLRHPLLLVGKTDGRCDLWDVVSDKRLRSLEHGGGTGGLLALERVVMAADRIVTLTHKGRLAVWSLAACRDPTVPQAKCLLWTHQASAGAHVTDVFASSTKLVLVEANSLTQSTDIKVLDFWTAGRQDAGERTGAGERAGAEARGRGKRKREGKDGRNKKCCAFC